MLPLYLALLAVTPRPILDPTDVRGAVRGVQAVSFDPAAPATAAGFELELRSRLRDPAEGDRFGGFLVAPLGGFALYGGYDWSSRGGPDVGRLSLGVSGFVSRRLALGAAYRRWWTTHDDTGALDLGAFINAASWLGLSVGVDQLNAPILAGEKLNRALRAGAALRPFAGDPRVTIAADTRFVNDAGGVALRQSRFLLDLAPLDGLHLLAAYVPGPEALWVGFSATAFGAELRTTADTGTGGGDALGQAAVAVVLRTAPAESLIRVGDRTVEVALTGSLEPKPTGLFGTRKSVSTAVLGLDALADDPSVGEVILDVGELEVGMATVVELRSAIARLRAHGKRVIAELAGGGEKEYLVAAAADRVRMDPATELVLDGFAATLFYLADGLHKIGVRFDAVAIGRYKTGPDPLVRNSARPEDKETLDTMLRLAYRTFTQALAGDRHLSPDAIAGIVEHGLVTAERAVQVGLVDELTQPTDPNALPRTRARGVDPASLWEPSRRWGERPIIAVVPIVGNIVGDGGSLLPGGSVDARTVVAELDRARRDPDVVAVVVRIDSPGGEVYASELMWRALRLLGSEKPLVVSMGDVAASGGYYVAAPADVILASPTTITGSIGIFTVKPDLSGLLELAGVNAEIFKIGKHADWNSLTRGLSDEEREVIRQGLTVRYDSFLARVAQGRKLPLERVRELAQGKVYTGEEALRLGLIDGYGDFADAVREAKVRAGLDEDAEVTIDVPEAPRSLTDTLSSLAAVRTSAADIAGEFYRSLARIDGVPLALLPYRIEIEP